MKMSNLLTLLKVGADVKLSKEQAQRLADLIEKLQQRIAELERYNVRLANESHEKDLKIDELAATVERLREAGTKLRDDIDLSKIVGAGKRNFANVWDAAVSATPAANLNHVKREVSVESYIEGFNQGRIKRPIVDLRNPIDLAKKYTNQRYPSVKDGE